MNTGNTIKVFLPEQYDFQGKISNNPIMKLKQIEGLEECYVEGYEKRGVKGWHLKRENGEHVLAVAKKTTANPFGSVLYLPDALKLPGHKSDLKSEYRWLHPSVKSNIEDSNLPVLCDQVRSSWEGAFKFNEEIKDVSGDLIKPGLRPPQIGALFAALAHWKVTKDIGTITMPTGTGKTETMLALHAQARLEHLLVIVPTSALRDQISKKFLTLGILKPFGIISKNVEFPVVGIVEHIFQNIDDVNVFIKSCNVTVATMAAIGRCEAEIQEALALNCSHLFIDEAHHAPAATWNNFRNLVHKAKKPILQFTATPYRRDGKHIGGKEIFSYPMRKAQEEGYFTPITFISIWEYNQRKSDCAIAERAIQALNEDLDAGYDHLLMARTNSIPRAEKVLQYYREFAPNHSPLIVHSQLNLGDQILAIEAIKTRQSRIIICVDMLGEGFDLPQLKVAALHEVHKSLAVTIQFIGRFTRTTSGIGEASIIANAADIQVEEALEDLYSKDADWNVVLRRLSEGATNLQRKQTEFLDGFLNLSTEISLQNIYPKMSTVVYKTSCKKWDPHATKRLLEKQELLLEPTINISKNVLVFITREQTPVAWGKSKTVNDLVHHLYLAYWDEKQELLFINSTNNKSTHKELAAQLVGENVELIRGEIVYRCLYGINRLILSNLGLVHLLQHAVQFTLHVGNDIKEGLSRAAVSNRKKSNIFSRGFENGKRVTIGASYKGRIWSQQIAEDISEWVEWCEQIGAKLLDASISTDSILENAIIPRVIDRRPNLVPLVISWPICFWRRSEESIRIEYNKQIYSFFDVELKITTFTDTGPIRFCFTFDDELAEYEIIFNKNTVQYRPLVESEVYFVFATERVAASYYFQAEYPIIIFEDSSQLEFNEIFEVGDNREPYAIDSIQSWDWGNTVLTKESQYKAQEKGSRLEYRPDSIQRYVIEKLLGEYGAEYDIIFDDDGSGEIADIVAISEASDELLVHFYHCKYSKSDQAGARVNDFYEVCGQAEKSIDWSHKVKRLFNRIKNRETQRLDKYNVSRFAKGGLEKLDELSRKSRFLIPKFHIYIVQPGLDKNNVSTEILDLLSATEFYLLETSKIPLTVITS